MLTANAASISCTPSSRRIPRILLPAVTTSFNVVLACRIGIADPLELLADSFFWLFLAFQMVRYQVSDVSCRTTFTRALFWATAPLVDGSQIDHNKVVSSLFQLFTRPKSHSARGEFLAASIRVRELKSALLQKSHELRWTHPECLRVYAKG